ncbi:hypothetical protein QLQ09_24215 [Brucella sp. NM4]|uniref:hypothetical protein n=1 Tax=Brucella sp. NM4 TaxID=3045175 RepID=UPI0024BBF022|nr:hypothetical protein [Brucella sp. NM4]WHS33933.1 hypothetical protein QLQ09_24215 [Brucella sp. NM4]
MLKVLYTLAALTTGATAATAAETNGFDGLYLSNIINDDCDQTIRDYKSSVKKGLQLLKKRQGTDDAEPSYILIKGREFRDTSEIRHGKIIEIQEASPAYTLFYFQGSGSVRKVSKLRIEHDKGNRWLLTEHLRGDNMDTLQGVGPINSILCKLQ